MDQKSNRVQAHTFLLAACLQTSNVHAAQGNQWLRRVAGRWRPPPWSQIQAAPGTPASSLLQFLRWEKKKKVKVQAEVNVGVSKWNRTATFYISGVICLKNFKRTPVWWGIIPDTQTKNSQMNNVHVNVTLLNSYLLSLEKPK